MKKIDLTGQRFGRLVVIKEAERRTSDKLLVWDCKCDCGEFSVVRSGALRSGRIKSCGCLNKEVNSKIMKTKSYRDKLIEGKKGKSLVEGTDLSLLTKRNNSNNASGHKGVSWYKGKKRWVAEITIKRKHIHLGSYTNKQDAINARLEAEEKYFKPILEKYKKDGVEELEGQK